MTHVVTARSDRLVHFMNPIAVIPHLWRHREMIWQFTRREVEGRYRGSFLGLVWSFVNPMVLLLTYTFVFGVVIKSRWQGSRVDSLSDYALVLFCGLVAFNIFSETVTRAAGLIIGVPNYVKKVIFPLEILPMSVLGAAVFQGMVSLCILLLACLIIQGMLHLSLFLLPLVLLPLLFLCMGLAWFLAGLGVYVRDINQTVVLVVQILFFLTPIFYSVSAVPQPFREIILLNPLTSVVENFRRIILWGKVPDWRTLIIWIGTTGLMMQLGYAWFMKAKKGFADVI